jgi:hypothetical protein
MGEGGQDFGRPSGSVKAGTKAVLKKKAISGRRVSGKHALR